MTLVVQKNIEKKNRKRFETERWDLMKSGEYIPDGERPEGSTRCAGPFTTSLVNISTHLEGLAPCDDFFCRIAHDIEEIPVEATTLWSEQLAERKKIASLVPEKVANALVTLYDTYADLNEFEENHVGIYGLRTYRDTIREARAIPESNAVDNLQSIAEGSEDGETEDESEEEDAKTTRHVEETYDVLALKEALTVVEAFFESEKTIDEYECATALRAIPVLEALLS